MAKKTAGIPRPEKRTDYVLHIITTQAERGWTDAVATWRNQMSDAWSYLTEHPTREAEGLCYQLKAELAVLSYRGVEYARYQYKFSHGGRIWYAVIEPIGKGKDRVPGQVLIERVETGHPNKTDPTKNFS